MQKVLIGLMVLAVSGCLAPQKKEAVAPVDLSELLSPGCYTVDLFDKYRIEYPDANVPRDVSDFLGVWKNGAWDGRLCHDLYITKASADGTVELIDAYGPDTKSGRDAVVFKRTGKVENGVLSFTSVGASPVSYQLNGDFLSGKRLDAYGRYEITMSREVGVALVPVPPIKPVRRS